MLTRMVLGIAVLAAAAAWVGTWPTGASQESTATRAPQESKVTAIKQDFKLEELAWMAGAWMSEEKGQRMEEHWMTPAGGVMVGMNRTAGTGKTFFEYLRIEAGREGLVYQASPMGQSPPTPFHLVELGKQRVVFENPKHDFPQRIIYRREENKLHARVEGKENGQERAEEWTWSLTKTW